MKLAYTMKTTIEINMCNKYAPGTEGILKVVYNNRSAQRMFAAMKRQRTRRDGGAPSGRACKLRPFSIHLIDGKLE